MTDLLIERLEEELVRQGFNYKSLSLAAGLGETTVRDIMIGRARNPRRDTLQNIARTLGLPLSYFLIDEASVPVTETGTYPAEEGVREHKEGKAPELVEMPPESGYRDMRAVRLHNDALAPFLPKGTVLYYNEPRKSGLHALLGRLCAVQPVQGPLSVGLLKPAAAYGRFDLASYSAALQEDIEISWAAPVLFIKQA